MPSRRTMLLHSLFIYAAGVQFGGVLGVVGSPLEGPADVKQVAIIGAGAAGSSAAYHLRKFADEAGVAVNVTLFERTDRVGGRTLTVNVYDDPAEPVEVGASIFVDVNHILSNATRDFNLTSKDPGSDEDGLLGIWDGESFVFTQDSASWNWVNLIRLFWKYGTAPYYTRKLVQSTVTTFLKLYEEPYFPFRSLSARAFHLGLVKITAITGRQFLAANNLAGQFSRDIVQAGTRVNYASNLDFIHGLGAMVAMAPEGAKAIKGGNWQIFSNMVEASKANLLLNTQVIDVGLQGDKKYRISTAKENDGENVYEAHSLSLDFDDVVIATPFQFANISMDEIALEQPIDPIPYATLHVTIFASPLKFSPEFFKMPPASDVPISVLTTLGANETALPGQRGAGKAGFFSATLLRVVTNPKTQEREFVYKIFSPEAVTPDFLSDLLGVDVPDSFTRDSTLEDDDEVDDPIDPVSWFHATVFHPYPQLSPRATFQDPVLRDGIYYTSGIESFISTMETSALMGMNVARLIVDDYAGIPRMTDDELEEKYTVPEVEEDKEVQMRKSVDKYLLSMQIPNEL